MAIYKLPTAFQETSTFAHINSCMNCHKYLLANLELIYNLGSDQLHL